MKSSGPTFDAFRLAARGESLEGKATMDDLPRLAESVLEPADVHYRIDGRIDDDGQPGALMRLSARLALRCERCNEPVRFTLERTVPFRFAADEQELSALPIEDDELEAVVGSAAMALHPWIEDEAILSLPLVPRHADCAVPGAPASAETADDARPNPFAALARLKRGGDDGPADH